MIPIRRRLYQSQPGFSPRQLFASLQGAWLEPTPGYIWQENTGVTPTTTGGQTIGRIADLSDYGNVATQATAGNRPTYQLDSNGLPLARHDATDSLVVSLPAINVRRNLLTYSEQFDNAAWTVTNSSVSQNVELSPNGESTAEKLIASAVSGVHNVTRDIFVTTGNTYTFSVYIKAAGYTTAVIGHGDSGGASWTARNVTVNLSTGQIVSQTVPGCGTITPISKGWYRVTVSSSAAAGNGVPAWRIYPNVSTSYTGDGTSGIYIWGAQLELGSTATDYQKITDWTSEAYSSNGSVYFATPVGMSALHNQSMGTSYTLPALSTDIYSWIVVPQRLNTAQENRLARYMERRAGIAGPDYLLDDNGNQLMSDDYELLLRQ